MPSASRKPAKPRKAPAERVAGAPASIQVEPHIGPARRAIWKGLRGYNRARLGRVTFKEVAVTVREGDDIVGGVVGQIWCGWLFIQLFWIDEAFRGEDRGTELIGKLEDEARAAGATHAYVDTFSFQAPDFYQKRGYRIFGELENFPVGHSRFWLTKAL
jgi:GNAT superfamily N-acetyltransferase